MSKPVSLLSPSVSVLRPLTAAAFCALGSMALALGLVLAPLSPAFAGQTITIDGDVDHHVYGNGDLPDGDAPSSDDPSTLTESPDDNTVIVNSGTLSAGKRVYGGYAHNIAGAATATGNSVTINGGQAMSAHGGYAFSQTGAATATGNSVTVNGGTMTMEVYGGIASSNFGTAQATGNTVTITGGTVNSEVGGGAAISNDDASSLTATGNTVNISGGTVTDDVYGGGADSHIYSDSGDATSGNVTATGNKVTISGGTVGGDIYGGYAYNEAETDNIADATSGNATASNNTVTINNSEVNGNIYGGFAYSGAETYFGDPTSGNAIATGNTVIINGGIVSGDVYGGWAENYVWYDSGGDADSGDAFATYNTVTISGAPDLSNSSIFGGHAESNLSFGDVDWFTGNTLNILNVAEGTTVTNVGNFEFFNFVFPSTQSGPVLTVTGDAYLEEDGGSNRSSIVTVSTLGGAAPVKLGETVTLIEANNLNAVDFTQTQTQGQHGALISYLWDLDVDSDMLLATVTRVSASPTAKSISEGRLAGLAFAGWGSDMIIGPGMYAAMMETKGKGAGLVPFAAVRGGSVRYDTGSHIDVDGFNLLMGLAWRAPVAADSSLITGAFFEAGWGSYDSRNSFSNIPSVKGKGDTEYYGGGVLGRYETKAGPGGVYGEASLRAGYAKTDFKSSNLTDTVGRGTSYDSGSMYYGVHLGGGYIWSINRKASLDLSMKYIWLHLDDDSVTISSGDRVKFKEINSHRLRLGGRFAYAVNNMIAPYAGAYFDYEFDGKAKGTVYGYKIDAPDLEGATGQGELGLVFTPAPNLPLSLDLGVQGYVGTREGVTGSLRVKYEF